MTTVNKLRSAFTKIIQNLTLFDRVVFVIAIIAFLVFFVVFKRENRFIEIRLKVSDPDPRSIYLRSPEEYQTAFHQGTKEYNELGQVVSEITRVDSYRTGLTHVDDYSFDPRSQTVYLNIRTKSVYSPRKKQYTIRGKPVVFGQSMTFVFENIKVEGVVVDFPGFTSTLDMPQEKKIVTAQLRDAQRFYSDTYGVPDYIASAIKAGDAVRDSNGRVLITVTQVSMAPAKRTVVTNGGSISIFDANLKDVYYTLEINAYKNGDRYYVYDYMPLSIGQYIPLNFPTISVLPTIIDIR